jgi:hypothetical protein
MREIVYQEAAKGVFEPTPTRAQKRQAKLAKEKRAERIDTALSIVAAGFIAIGCIAFFSMSIFADQIWPAIRP